MKKNRNIWLFIVSFSFYFILGIIFSYLCSTVDKINLFFDADSIRVFEDLTVTFANHYRTTVHPLFVILFQCIILIIRPIFSNPILTSLVLQSCLTAGSILLMKLILDKLKINKYVKYLLIGIFSVSFSQLIFNATIETYSFAQFFNLLLFYWVLRVKDKKLTNIDYFIFVLIGVYILGITITNFVLYIFTIVYLIYFKNNKNKDKKINFLTLIILIMSPILISMLLSILQYFMFPNSSLYFKDLIISLFNGSSEEYHFVSTLNITSIINQIKNVFCYGFIAPKISLILTEYNDYSFIFNELYLIQKIIISLILVFIVVVLVNYFKNKNIKDKKIFSLLLISFLFNFGLHLIYGNDTGFLYTLHYQFIIIILIALIINNLKGKLLKNSIILLSLFLILEIISNCYGLYYIYNKILNIVSIQHVGILGVLIALVTVISVVLCFKLNKKRKIILIIFIILLNVIFKIYSFNTNNYKYTYYENKAYSESYEKYLIQLNNLYRDMNVRVRFNQSNKIMFFGMGNRKKILYKNGTLYDMENNYEVIKKYDIKNEMIIPNEYTVSLLTRDNKEIIIYEDEYGIYLKNNENIETIDRGDKINLPNFKDYKYSEVLKVLHQEILFNIDDSKLIPNLLVYDEAWYRDGMMATMVLEKTNNLDLIKDWIDSINEIYDEQNGNKEVDNLGELLYMLEITGSNNKIKDEIFKEVNRIKSNNSLTGVIDGNFKTYYPTAIMLYALEFSDKDLGLKLPKYDVYSEIVWYYDFDKKINTSTNSPSFPYLGWANYHTNGKGKLYNCDKLYPLSYERGASKARYDLIPKEMNNYNKLRVSPTHLWDASEKFLVLYEK